jgi:Flp pilus assembly protein TadD
VVVGFLLMRSWVERRSVLVATVLLVGLVAAVYAGSLSNGPVWDDVDLVTDNPFLRTLDGLSFLWKTDLWTASAKREPSSYYRPLTMATFWVNVQIAGPSAASARVGNIALHAGNAVLLMLLLRRLLEPPRLLLAVSLASTWAVMAVNSEPVLWISGRFDPLIVAAALACLLSNRRSDWRGVALVLLFVACGLLSKEAFMGWLPLLLLDDLLVLRRRLRTLIPKYVGVIAVVGLNLALRRWVEIPSLSVIASTGLIALVKSYLFTVATLVPRAFVPVRLDPFHPYVPLPIATAVTVGVVLCSLSVWLAWRALRTGADESARVAAFGWCWVLLGLVPASVTGPNLFMIGDRYAYLPMVGLIIMAHAALGPVLARLERRWGRRVLVVAGVVMAVAAAGQAWATVTRCPAWRNDRTLAEASVRAHPDNPYALYSLGMMALDAHNLDEAEPLLLRALRGNPLSWRTPNAICVLRLRQGRLVEARASCERSLALNPKNPRAWVNLASVDVKQRDWERAMAASLRAVEIKPHFAEARYLAAVSAANLGRRSEAHEHLRAGLEQDPSHVGLLDLQRQLERRR